MLYKNTETIEKQSLSKSLYENSSQKQENGCLSHQRMLFSKDNQVIVACNNTTEFHDSISALKKNSSSLFKLSRSILEEEKRMLMLDLDPLCYEAELAYEKDLERFTSIKKQIPSFFVDEEKPRHNLNELNLTYNHSCLNVGQKQSTLQNNHREWKERKKSKQQLRNYKVSNHFLSSGGSDLSVIRRKGLAFHEDANKETSYRLCQNQKEKVRAVKTVGLDKIQQPIDISGSCEESIFQSKIHLKTKTSLSSKDIKEAYAFIDLINEANREGDSDHLIKQCIMNDVISNMQDHHEAMKLYLEESKNQYSHCQKLERQDGWMKDSTQHKGIFSSSESLSEKEKSNTADKPCCF